MLYLLWTVLTPAAFLILAQTLGRFKVRRVHLLRALAYSLPSVIVVHTLFTLLFVVIGVWTAKTGVAPIPYFSTRSFHTLCQWSLVILTVVWQASWCSAYVYRYLRIPHALLTVFLLLFVSLLAAILLMWFR
ncbi:MAG: hypothetical protein U0638_10640 [Phycisphaerales bacterium]